MPSLASQQTSLLEFVDLRLGGNLLKSGALCLPSVLYQVENLSDRLDVCIQSIITVWNVREKTMWTKISLYDLESMYPARAWHTFGTYIRRLNNNSYLCPHYISIWVGRIWNLCLSDVYVFHLKNDEKQTFLKTIVAVIVSSGTLI